eukprot:gnl/TRDRNA2_/TRDRNA2_187395_c0_seq1.p1 gnl/TRDRNA2_/TRDRNA2_187395_c0~~gnl/TRDRNA2_/TRDRNA2_187395_c0_seq1.p1  ORF type:complete len:397 (-),score=54.48 gnl/TRDRNA2_/TRDRNA2_187395_c0_seq1:283-1473(-)
MIRLAEHPQLGVLAQVIISLLALLRVPAQGNELRHVWDACDSIASDDSVAEAARCKRRSLEGVAKAAIDTVEREEEQVSLFMLQTQMSIAMPREKIPMPLEGQLIELELTGSEADKNESLAGAQIPGHGLQKLNSKAGRDLQNDNSFLRSTKHSQLEIEGAKNGLDPGIMVIIPGLGDAERSKLVKRNIAWLRTSTVPFDCEIFVYRTEAEFPLNPEEFSPCKLTRHPGFWMQHIAAFDLSATQRSWILHMLDGIEPENTVNLQSMIDISQRNGLGHAAPTLHPCEGHATMQSCPNSSYTVGRFVDFIEMNFDLFSREHFACLQDAIDPDNKMGWGVDVGVPSLCKHPLGYLDHMLVNKRFGGSYNYTEATRQATAYYAKHPDIKPAKHVTLGSLV